MIRTAEELLERIGKDHIWRRKELTELRALVEANKGHSIRLRLLVRAAVAMLYAHWEGFVKKSSSDYLEYVASNRLPYRRLATNFVALSLKAKFKELSTNKRMSGANAIATFFCLEMDKQSNVPYKKEIDTSNLSSKVLSDVLESLGLDIALFATRLNYIDANLVTPRNHIAHGEALEISVSDYLELHENVL
jgi:hypothetical protein